MFGREVYTDLTPAKTWTAEMRDRQDEHERISLSSRTASATLLVCSDFVTTSGALAPCSCARLKLQVDGNATVCKFILADVPTRLRHQHCLIFMQRAIDSHMYGTEIHFERIVTHICLASVWNDQKQGLIRTSEGEVPKSPHPSKRKIRQVQRMICPLAAEFPMFHSDLTH